MTSNLARWLGIDPVIFAAFGLIVFGILVVVGWQIAAEDDPVRARVFRGEAASDDSRAADFSGTVGESSAGSIVVRDLDGIVDVAIPLETTIQTLVPERVGGPARRPARRPPTRQSGGSRAPTRECPSRRAPAVPRCGA